ncbi:MAG TPA: glutamate--tRNA ligase [Gammaproteobacteria bacterium]|jgi:glutamyl-tRNA synthetase|nr:glutamate--tRNA ligase [Gammaproteobacteria bacterium]
MTTRTRFAPSPTGEIHVGNARTALFCALLAARDGGTLILRIEDTDAARSLRSHEDEMRADLAWLGVRWQEGPDVGGPKGPYRQSERGELYAAKLEQLATRGRVYPCFCTALELEVSRKAQLSAGKPPRYAGTCAKLSVPEIEARIAKGLKPAIRFRVPEEGETVFMDLVRSRQVFAHKDIGDFIIQRADGSPAFFFSNAVDDALMGVTHVLRGEDHLANTPRQLLLLDALGLKAPQYAHLSLIVGQGGAPLSKREGGGSLRELRAEGVLPEALLNYLARLGHTYSDNAFADFDTLARGFDVSHLGHSPAHFDHTQLDHWQGEAVRHAADERLWDWLVGGRQELERMVPERDRKNFVEAVRGNITRPSHGSEWATVVYGDLPPAGDEADAALHQAAAGFFDAVLGVLRQSAPEFKPFAKAVGAATGQSGKALYQPLRAALTGRLDGPEMERLWRLMDPKLIEARFDRARAANL